MYYDRSITQLLKDAFKFFPVVMLTGARQVGKSTLAMKLVDNYVTFDDVSLFSSARTDPVSFLKGLKKPVVLDEVQRIPELLHSIKQDVDAERKNGTYLLTGSANIMLLRNISETLAGRVALFELWPLSAREIHGKPFENVLEMLFDGAFLDYRPSNMKYGDILGAIISGGYPDVVKIRNEKGRYLWFSSYVATYLERDVRDIGELRNIEKFLRTFHILAPQSANLINKTALSMDASVNIKSLENYLNLLQLVYQIYFLKPYTRNIRKRVVKSSKFFFTDSGMLSHLLGVNNREDLLESPYKGLILETFIFSEIMKGVKYNLKPSGLFYYRTVDGKEIDFIIEREGKLVAIEVKFSRSVSFHDFKVMVRFAESQNNFAYGFVFYLGNEILPFGKNLFALPVKVLF